jgi:hypothetical protein
MIALPSASFVPAIVATDGIVSRSEIPMRDRRVFYNDYVLPNLDEKVILLKFRNRHYELLLQGANAWFEPLTLERTLKDVCMNCYNRYRVGLVCSNYRTAHDEQKYARSAIEAMAGKQLNTAGDKDIIKKIMTAMEWTFYKTGGDDIYIESMRAKYNYQLIDCNLDTCFLTNKKLEGPLFDFVFFQGCFLRRESTAEDTAGVDKFLQCVQAIANSLSDNGHFIQRTHPSEDADQVWDEYFVAKRVQTVDTAEYSIRQKIPLPPSVHAQASGSAYPACEIM